MPHPCGSAYAPARGTLTVTGTVVPPPLSVQVTPMV
jgi:hypothetical protein